MKRRQTGIAAVEFAVAAPAAFIVLFGCIEIGRALFVWNTITEATRRAARVAAVVDPVLGLTTILSAATAFGNAAELKATNIQVNYYDSSGNRTLVANNMAFVTVSVTGVTHPLFIPFVDASITVPPFTTTVPMESKGYNPDAAG